MTSLYPHNMPSILPREDYDALLEHSRGARAVLEFGPGVSTRAFFENRVLKIVSYEHSKNWLRKQEHRLRPLVPEGVWWELRHYMGRGLLRGIRGLEGKERYDMAFVDAPPGGNNWVGPPGGEAFSRWNTFSAALCLTDKVLLHDANRPGEQRTLQESGCKWEMITEKTALCWTS